MLSKEDEFGSLAKIFVSEQRESPTWFSKRRTELGLISAQHRKGVAAEVVKSEGREGRRRRPKKKRTIPYEIRPAGATNEEIKAASLGEVATVLGPGWGGNGRRWEGEPAGEGGFARPSRLAQAGWLLGLGIQPIANLRLGIKAGPKPLQAAAPFTNHLQKSPFHGRQKKVQHDDASQ